MSCRRNTGFTLAELLVATVLLSVVMSSVYTMFYAVLVPWRAVENDYDAYRAARNAMTLIDREVNNIVPGAWHLFEGKDDETTLFVVSEPMDVEKSEGRHVMRVRYAFKKAKGTLVREEALVMSPLPLPPQPGKEIESSRLKLKDKQDFVIATNVEDYSVRYVWLPQPPNRKATDPPVPIKPMYTTQHNTKWGIGYPQAIEFTLKLRDPEKKGGFQTVTKTIPLPGKVGPTMKILTEKLGGGLSS